MLRSEKVDKYACYSCFAFAAFDFLFFKSFPFWIFLLFGVTAYVPLFFILRYICGKSCISVNWVSIDDEVFWSSRFTRDSKERSEREKEINGKLYQKALEEHPAKIRNLIKYYLKMYTYLLFCIAFYGFFS